jgi:NifB/MoaA-like Fe-S oxidoreductase
MIVIPTYNGFWSLSRLIHSLETFGTNGHKVVVMDNGTTDIVSKKYL